MLIRLFLAVGILVTATFATAAEPAKFELRDGDRVVFLGNTLVEREQKYGHWELMLTMAWPERNVTFRNLGWSGDTVWGESRAGFGTQADGFKALVEQVNAAKPTVIFVGYGNVEAFDGEAGLPRFIEGFNKLLDELEKTKARIVVLGPVPQAVSVSFNPTAVTYNKHIRLYSNAMLNVSAMRSYCFVDLASNLEPVLSREDLTKSNHRLTDEMGVLTSLGYQTAFHIIAQELNVSRYGFDPYSSNAIQLIQTIIKKNELFFHRWRPQNETYLFGFRKHEQGNNAQEVFEFDPLIAAEEKKIAELRTKLATELKKASELK